MKDSHLLYYSIFNCPIGNLLLIGKEDCLLQLRFENSWDLKDITHLSQDESIFRETLFQLDEYFKGKRKSFSLPIKPQGTVFQTKVWRELQNIPYGRTSSYGEVAQRINNPKGCRAVGMANGKNPIPIIIPCHRVIGKNGSLTGFGGGVKVKQQLLTLEQGNIF